ncbi:MAG TPA: cytochrome c biogenesis protein ResB [Nitriliruptorales bacterium]
MSQVDSAPPPEANPEVRPSGGPRIPGPGEAVVLFWRWLRRMKSALYLLGLLGVLTVIATLVPQQPNVPTTVRAWRAGTEGPGVVVSGLLDAVGAYDMYGAPIFLATLALLFTSLTACLIPRYRAWWRLLRRSRPPASGSPDHQPYVQTFGTTAPRDEVLAAARTHLRGRRWRLRDPGPDAPDQVAAERGHVLREGGSLLFHTSFYLLLIGVVVGQLVSFSGQVGIVEGQSWADTAVGYWSYSPGRLWGDDDHRAFTLTVDEFEVDWYRDPEFGGTPKVFLAHVTVTRADGSSYQDTVGGNDPLVIDGMKVHLLDWGYAPRVVVFEGGQVVHDAHVTLGATEQGLWRGAVKAPSADPDVGLNAYLYPYAPERENGPVPTGAPWADDPLLAFEQYRGDLRLDRVQNVNTLDLTGLQLENDAYVRPGEVIDLGNGVVVAFPELRRWVGLQISNRPTVPLLLLAAGLILLGLVPSLYAHRRRVWVHVRDVGDHTRVTVAGRTFQRPQAFEPEFARVVAALRDRLPPAPDPEVPATPDLTEVLRR